MKPIVTIPWRGGDAERERNHRIVLDHFKQILPDVTVVSIDSEDEPFSRAASRNSGVRYAESSGADVVVICDADTLVEQGSLLEAIAAAEDGLLHLPYNRYRSLTKLGTLQFLQGTPLLECAVDHDHGYATGGVLVIKPASWWEFGGMDPGYFAWG